MTVSEPTVFVVDDDPEMRGSLKELLQAEGFSVEAYASASEFLDEYDAARPGCLLLDLRMPGIDGISLQEQLAEHRPGLPIIVITGYGSVPLAARSFKLGAVDFLEKPFKDEQLIADVRTALAVDARNRHRDAMRLDIRQRLESLSPRERQVLDRVVAGQANKTIAAELGITQRTVEVHRANVMGKMKAESLPELVQQFMLAQDDADDA
jgi:FixJ family two-component response regulator